MRLRCRDLGTTGYQACWELQRSLFEELLARKTVAAGAAAHKIDAPDNSGDIGTVLLTEHEPVYTLGKSGHAENLLVNRTRLEELGARFFHIDRGGDITFHGPGQLVGYPILGLGRLGVGATTSTPSKSASSARRDTTASAPAASPAPQASGSEGPRRRSARSRASCAPSGSARRGT